MNLTDIVRGESEYLERRALSDPALAAVVRALKDLERRPGEEAELARDARELLLTAIWIVDAFRLPSAALPDLIRAVADRR